MERDTIERAAAEVARRRLAKERLAALDGIRGEDAGYAVQRLANARLEARLGPVVGHKIGGTTEAMRRLIGACEPVAGEVFAETVHPTPARLSFDAFLRPGIETEIAVRLGRDLPPGDAPFDRSRVAEAVAEVMAAIEIVDDRYEDFRRVGIATIVADNAFNAASILGEPRREWRGLDLAGLVARTRIDGRCVAEARSDALMGHPFEALRWLADRRAVLGHGLAAGSFVSLGTITPVQWLDRPCEVRIEVEELGEVVLRLD